MNINSHNCTPLQCDSDFVIYAQEHLYHTHLGKNRQREVIAFKNVLNEFHILHSISALIRKDITYVPKNEVQGVFGGIFIVSHTTEEGSTQKYALSFGMLMDAVSDELEGGNMSPDLILEVIAEVANTFDTAGWSGSMKEFLGRLYKGHSFSHGSNSGDRKK